MGSRTVRLFQLHPDNGDFYCPLSGDLIIVNLTTIASYEALSYAWGREGTYNESRVAVAGGHLKITYNLDTALRHIRLRDRTRVLWIDAVCINQSDDVEKSDQVAQMRDVYEFASTVLVWLGNEGLHSETGLKLLEDLLHKTYVRDRDQYPYWFSPHQNWWHILPKEALNDILYRDWWNRVWVLQEVAVAKRVRLICGYNSMSWPSRGTG
jgi:hypothetical protein